MNSKKLVIILAVTLVAYIMVDVLLPPKHDYSINLSKKSSMPYGCEILYKVINNTGQVKVEQSLYPIYNLKSETETFNYIAITNYFNPDDLDIEYTFDYVSSGATFLIAAFEFNNAFLEKLGIEKNTYLHLQNAIKKDSAISKLIGVSGDTAEFVFMRMSNSPNFLVSDTLGLSIDTIGINRYDKPDALKISYGEGTFILCCKPLFFTNYHMVEKENYAYSISLLNYLHKDLIYWDEFYKPNRAMINASPLRFVLKTPPLRIAWYILLIVLFLYILFNSRRQQRKIPIVELPVNASLEFTTTLGQLYHQNGDHVDLVHKKMTHFKSFIQRKYNVKAKNGVYIVTIIAEKSGLTEKEIDEIFTAYNWISTRQKISETELNRFVSMINKFYKSCN